MKTSHNEAVALASFSNSKCSGLGRGQSRYKHFQCGALYAGRRSSGRFGLKSVQYQSYGSCRCYEMCCNMLIINLICSSLCIKTIKFAHDFDNIPHIVPKLKQSLPFIFISWIKFSALAFTFKMCICTIVFKQAKNRGKRKLPSLKSVRVATK